MILPSSRWTSKTLPTFFFSGRALGLKRSARLPTETSTPLPRRITSNNTSANNPAAFARETAFALRPNRRVRILLPRRLAITAATRMPLKIITPRLASFPWLKHPSASLPGCANRI